MKKSSRRSRIDSATSYCRPVRAGAKYFVSAAGGNVTNIEIVSEALSREDYINRGHYLMSMPSLHKAGAIRISSEAR